MKYRYFTVIPMMVMGMLTATVAQDKPVAKAGNTFYLKLQGTTTYLSQNSADYATVGAAKAGYVIGSGNGDLTNGSTHKISLGGKYLYETAKGNAGFYSSAPDSASSWKIEKQKGECTNKDDTIRHGDVIQLSNGYWTDNYLCNYDNSYAAAGTYNKPRNWIVEFDLPEVKVAKGAYKNTQDVVVDVIFVSNLGLPAVTGAKTTWTLNTSDEVGVAKSGTDQWQASVTVGVSGDILGSEVSVEASAAFSQTFTEERSNVSKIEKGKSIEINHEKPANGECFLIAELSIPYGQQELSCNGSTIQMRSFNGQVSLASLDTILIPHRNGDTIVPVLQSKVDNCLQILAQKSPRTVDRLRAERLPEWRRNGWVVDKLPEIMPTPTPTPAPATFVDEKKPGTSNKVKPTQPKKEPIKPATDKQKKAEGKHPDKETPKKPSGQKKQN